MWIRRALFDQLNAERLAAVKAHADLHAELLKTMGIQAGLIHENAAHKTTLDWARVRINHLERQFAATLYSKTGVELPIPKIESSPVEQTSPNMLPDFEHISEDDPAFKAHPEWYSTGSDALAESKP